MSILIRNTTLADIRETTQIHIATWQSAYKGIIPQPFLDKMSDDYEVRVEKWSKTLSDVKDGYSLLAEVGGKIVGILHGGQSRHSEYPHDKEVYAIYVLDEYQGKGVGRKLLQTIAKTFSEEKASGMIIWVLEENISKGFYEALGGKHIGNRTIEIAGKKLDERGYGWMPLFECQALNL